MKSQAVRRRAARTVLLVGEGDAEVLFLQHLKSLYVQRGSGVAVTIKNARGKGAAHVVDFARRQSSNAAFDAVAALLDTDTDWSDKTQAAARKARVQVITCEPCLEAVLLAVHQRPVQGRSSAQLKKDFFDRFGAHAHQAAYALHFDTPVLTQAHARVQVMQQLWALMTSPSAV
jgi:hypothetical protein